MQTRNQIEVPGLFRFAGSSVELVPNLYPNPFFLRRSAVFGNVESAAVDALVLEQLQLARNAAADGNCSPLKGRD